MKTRYDWKAGHRGELLEDAATDSGKSIDEVFGDG